MTVQEAIIRRRSIRKYQARQVPREDLEAILAAGLYAPNAGGGQRSILCAIRDPGLAAYERGIASCIVARAEETFDTPLGRSLMQEWDIPEGYTARCFVTLGYVEGPYPQPKPRCPGRTRIIEPKE